MSINSTAIAEYLASCKPEAPRKVDFVYTSRANIVPFEPKGDLYPLSQSDQKVIGLMNVLCGNIEQATDGLIVGDEVIPTSECDEASEILVEAISQAIEKTIAAEEAEAARLIPITENALAWAKQQLLFVNSWQLLETDINRLATAPAAGLAMVHMLEDAKKVNKDMLRDMAVAMRIKVRELLSRYDELSHSENKEELTGRRPADIYRAFAKPLEWLIDNGCRMLVGPTYRYLLEDQTLPLAELDNPDWVDPYTGSLDKEAQEYRYNANGTVDELTDEEREAADASEAFNADDGLDEVFEQDERRGIVEADGDEDIEKDFQFSAEIRKSDDYTDLCRRMSNVRTLLKQTLGSVRMAVKLREYDTQEQIDAWVMSRMRLKPVYKEFYQALKAEAENTDGHNERKVGIMEARQRLQGRTDGPYILRLAQRAKNPELKAHLMKMASATNELKLKKELEHALDAEVIGAWPADMAFIAAEFQTDDCYPIEMFNTIRLYPQQAGCETLGQWMDLFGDEVLENSWDEAPRIHSTDQVEIDEYVAETFQLFVTTNVDEKSENVEKSRPYLEAYFNVGFNAKSIFKVDEKGFKHNLPKEAGYEAWRQAKSPAGNIAYHQAIAAGKSPKEATRAFYLASPQNQTAPAKKDAVKAIQPDKSGLVLQSGRKVSWRIAMLKQRGEELDWVGDLKDRVKAKLTDLGVGLDFASML